MGIFGSSKNPEQKDKRSSRTSRSDAEPSTSTSHRPHKSSRTPSSSHHSHAVDPEVEDGDEYESEIEPQKKNKGKRSKPDKSKTRRSSGSSRSTHHTKRESKHRHRDSAPNTPGPSTSTTALSDAMAGVTLDPPEEEDEVYVEPTRNERIIQYLNLYSFAEIKPRGDSFFRDYGVQMTPQDQETEMERFLNMESGDKDHYLQWRANTISQLESQHPPLAHEISIDTWDAAKTRAEDDEEAWQRYQDEIYNRRV